MISIIILTFNDENNVYKLFQSIKSFTDDIHVIDSFSTDKTKEIVEEFNFNLTQRKFINQAEQINWGLDNLNFKYDWIMRLDSDEVVPLDLQREIIQEIQYGTFDGFYINRKMIWMGQWLRYGRMYPHYILRIFRKNSGRYELKTEEHFIINGKTKKLKNHFYEDNKKNTLQYFTEKHLVTAEGEVKELIINNNLHKDSSLKANLFGTKIERTRFLKLYLYNNLPVGIRALMYFCYRYFICLGFLDGKPGLIWHLLQGFWYRFYIDSRIYEENIKK